MRIYNIGYYGSSIKGQLSWLDKIFGDVYSDTKMVGIALGINDRGEVASLDKDVSYGQYYANVKAYLIQMVEWLISHHFEPFMVTNQIVIQIGSSTNDIPVFAQEARNGIQTMCNKAKIEVAKLYNLEVIDMNSFGELLLKSSNVSIPNLIQDRLHFNDLGHRLEAGYLFSELVPYVYKTNNTSVLHIGLNTRNFNTDIACAKYIEPTTNDYKYQLNKDRQEQTDILVFDCYIFVNSDNGSYNVKYLTPYASGYIVIDGDTTNPISITSTEINLGTWDIGLHHVQVYTGTSNKVAFKGFLLEQ